MTELNDLEWSTPLDDPTRPERPVRTCRRHKWDATIEVPEFDDEGFASGGFTSLWGCSRCGRIKDEAVSRRGRTNRQRGNAQEREWCKRLGLTRVGHHGGIEDGRNEMFVGQSKSLATGRFPRWMSDELDKLPRDQARIPILGVLETPGIGHKPRRLVVLDEADWIALHAHGETK